MIGSGFSGIRLAGRNVTLALMITTALSACTSVEYAEKPEIETPKVAKAQTAAVATSGMETAAADATGQAPPATETAAATAAPGTVPATTNPTAFVAPQAPAAAAATQVAMATTAPAQPAAVTGETTARVAADANAIAARKAAEAEAIRTAMASAPRSTEQPTVVPVKADPPWVKSGRVHPVAAASTAPTPVPAGATATANAQFFPEMPLPYEVSEIRSVIPAPKPGGTMLAYAGGPQNAAFSAIDSLQPTAGPVMGRGSAAAGPELNGLIDKYATLYGVPKDLVHRVVHRESRYNPGAYSKGNFGLMQIRHATARSLGFQGPANGLLDAETNLKYAVKYLKGAWTVADKDKDAAVRLYAKGYYYEAKRKGLLHVMQ